MKGRGLSTTQIWAALVVLTIVSVSIAEKRTIGGGSGGAVVCIAAIKARWIVLDYMEARHTPPPWRPMFEAWLAACTVLMLSLAVFT